MTDMKKFVSMLLAIATCLCMSIPAFATEISSAKYVEMTPEELAYCDIDAAPAQIRSRIIEARSNIINSSSWTVDGQCAVQHADGTIEEVPEFSDLFPDWDIPEAEASYPEIMPLSVNYVGYVYLRHPGTTTTNPFYTFYPNVSKTIKMGMDSFGGTSWNARYDNISTGKEVGHQIELAKTDVYLLRNPNTSYAYGSGASTYSTEGEALMYVTYQ